ncbi:MAG: phosphatidate cytidylyltransferase [Paludibacteraceae bacterium]|nr:phosphatidate cytidylyltransferase [Paludibacteraceae bacterium]
MNNLATRTITGTVFVTAIVASILFQQQYYTFSALFAIFNILAMKEYYGIINKKQNVSVPVTYMIISGTLLYFGCFWFTLFEISGNYIGYAFLILYMLSLAFLVIYELYRNKEHPTYDLAFSFLGQAVVAFPFGLLNFIARSPYCLLALFIMIWTFDTGAYLFGSTFGKHKMIPHVSPKKSWEGEIGGALTTVAVAIGIAYYLSQPIWEWIIFALIVVVFGTYGDLSESMLKRASGLKDSGNILPGHGGMLDRFDSMLLAAPMVYIYLEILRGFEFI